MEKGFLKSTGEKKHLYAVILLSGVVITTLMGIRAYGDTVLRNGYELSKEEQPEDGYEQKLVALVNDQKVPLTVTVKPRQLAEKEVLEEFSKAESCLPMLLKGTNETLSKVTADLNFVEQIPESPVTVTWTEIPTEYFDSAGKIRDDIELSEMIEVKLKAVLSCQEYTRDYEVIITILPRKTGIQNKLLQLVMKSDEADPENKVLVLPKEYEGEVITWSKPLDFTFLYFGTFTVGAVLLLKLGEKRDEREAKKEWLAAMEKDYAQIVSKFTMLLSAGLSIRNAWERIVLMNRRNHAEDRAIYRELQWGLKELQKGVSELEVYELFAARTGQIHYKKLMGLFISHKKRGGGNLLDAMNQEMLSAFEEQKRKTRQEGEKIGTKLMLPMMGMLGIVFIMILVPAFLSFQL